MLRIGVDIGGTFTDVVIVTNKNIYTHKILSRNLAPETAILQAIASLNLPSCPNQLLHSTTLVTNMLLENKGAKTGFITSTGMRDILHIARHKRPLNYAIRQIIPWQHCAPIPRKWRLTVPERIGNNGEIITPLDEGAVAAALQQLLQDGVESIAIGFLHSYSHPQHEQLAGKILKKLAPEIAITLSAEVSPRFREYERFMTAALNARIKPAVNHYLNNIHQQIAQVWPTTRLMMMTSNGGLEQINAPHSTNPNQMSDRIDNSPIRLALSGLAAAGNAFVHIAKQLSLPHCIGLDVGGTSADVTVIKDYKLHEAPLEQRTIAGFPLQIPMLDLHTVGAGGGSLIYKDEFGELHVGPQSAGAEPGPASYGLGGELPTITDAAIVIGRLPPDLKLAGTIPISKNLAQVAITHKFNLQNEQQALKIAADALLLVEANIAYAIRERTIERGLNPQNMALIVAGGAGGILACGIADVIGIGEIIIPPHPGLLAAWGLLAAPLQQESTLMVLKTLANLTDQDLQQLFTTATNRLNNNFPCTQLKYAAALRYLGQGFEVDLEFDTVPKNVSTLKHAFQTTHQKEYGFALTDSAIEWIELRVKQIQPLKTIEFSPCTRNNQPQESAFKLWDYDQTTKNVRAITAILCNRTDLPENYVKSGPIIITEDNATTYVAPDWKLIVLANGFMKITREFN